MDISISLYPHPNACVHLNIPPKTHSFSVSSCPLSTPTHSLRISHAHTTTRFSETPLIPISFFYHTHLQQLTSPPIPAHHSHPNHPKPIYHGAEVTTVTSSGYCQLAAVASLSIASLVVEAPWLKATPKWKTSFAGDWKQAGLLLIQWAYGPGLVMEMEAGWASFNLMSLRTWAPFSLMTWAQDIIIYIIIIIIIINSTFKILLLLLLLLLIQFLKSYYYYCY